MNTALRHIARAPRYLLVALVRLYQLVVSPHFPSACRYEPTCSAYAAEAVATYGAVRGTILAVHRLARCHPWSRGGYDPPRWYGEPRPEAPEADAG